MFLFYGTGLTAMAWIAYTRWEIMYYVNHLWLQYIIYVMLSTTIYHTRYPVKESICLGFLTTFLNSYYWELPLHLADYIQGFPSYQLHIHLPQLWRLYPLTFFLPRYKFADKKHLWAGFIISCIIMILALGPLRPLKQILYTLNRVACLLILTYTIIKSYPTHPDEEYCRG